MPSQYLNLSFLDFAASGFAARNLNTVATDLVDSDLCVIVWLRGPFFGLSRTRLPWVCTQYIIKAPANKNYWSPPEDNPHKHRLPDIGAALSRGVFQKGSRILDFRVSFDWE